MQEQSNAPAIAFLAVGLLLGLFFLYIGYTTITRRDLPRSLTLYPPPPKENHRPDSPQPDPQPPARITSVFWLACGLCFMLLGISLVASAMVFLL